MKRLFLILLAVCILLSVCAFAETEVTLTVSGLKNIEFNPQSNLLAVYSSDTRMYSIMDCYGNLVNSQEFYGCRNRGTHIVVQGTADYINGNGALDKTGALVVPCEYTAIEEISKDWVIAAHTVDSDENQYDYKVSSGSTYSFQLIDRWDVYYKDTLAGSLGRTEYDYAYAYGAYLVVRSVAGEYSGYDKNLTKSPLALSSSSEYMEVRENGSYVYYHAGSGQKAFCAGCTLSADEVSQFIMGDRQGNYCDLQGNFVFSISGVADYVSKFNEYGYAYFTKGGLKGVINTRGEVVIPAKYSSLDVSYGFNSGYMAVYSDGKLAFCDEQGTQLTEFKYTTSSANNCFGAVKDVDGSYIILTPLGELPTRYTNASIKVSLPGCPLLVVVDSAKGAGVIGLAGEEVIPLSSDYKDSYSIELSYDGSVAVIMNSSTRAYEVYTISYDVDSAISAGVAAVSDGSWICPVCSTRQTGNFCPNDGTKKPD